MTETAKADERVLDHFAEAPFSLGAVLHIPTDEEFRLGHVLEATVTGTFV